MGANDSKSTTDVVQETVVNVLNNFMSDQTSECAAANVTKQSVSFSNSGEVIVGDINLDISSSINFKCLNQQQVDANSTSDLSSKLDSAVKNMTTQLQNIGQVNKSEVNVSLQQKATTTLGNNFQLKQVSSCITSAVATQSVDVSFVQKFTAGDINANIDSKMVTECVQKNGAVQQAVADITNSLGSTVDNTVKQGLDLTNLALIGIFILVGIVLVFFVGPEIIINALLKILVGIITLPIELLKSLSVYFNKRQAPAPPVATVAKNNIQSPPEYTTPSTSQSNSALLNALSSSATKN